MTKTYQKFPKDFIFCNSEEDTFLENSKTLNETFIKLCDPKEKNDDREILSWLSGYLDGVKGGSATKCEDDKTISNLGRNVQKINGAKSINSKPKAHFA